MSRTMQEDGDMNLFHSCFAVEAEEISKTLTKVSFRVEKQTQKSNLTSTEGNALIL